MWQSRLVPLYELICPRCDECLDAYVPVGADSLPDCEKCGSERSRAGLATFSMRTPAPTGMKMASGEFVKGTFGPPPRRVARRIKTF